MSNNYYMDADFGTYQELRGQSAYEVAKENGFEGTEEEWLESLKGEPGKDGKDGEPGKDGNPGKDGYTPIKGVDYFDGEKGEKGDVGGIVTGTYVSTNEAGEDYPCSLTFDFVPKMLILWGRDAARNDNRTHQAIINLVDATEEFSTKNATMSNVATDNAGLAAYYYPDTGMNSKVVGTTVYWYHSSRWKQFNFSNYPYAYMAIGGSASGSGGGVGDLDEISAALDRIIEIQNQLIGGDGV